MSKILHILLIIAAAVHQSVWAYSVQPSQCSRRQVFGLCTSSLIASTATIVFNPSNAQAFDGSGASAYAGRNPITNKAELRKSYQDRIAADVKDFKDLGEAIEKGVLDGEVWVKFFIQYQRREPDSVGRTYAALADLVGTQDFSGCGNLLASSYAKPGKPSDGLPSVKKYNAMAKTFDPIKNAGAKGDGKKAKSAYETASLALSAFLLEKSNYLLLFKILFMTKTSLKKMIFVV
mmetsp:Transcript_8467/g.10706  ORF Transcript_8467/g.10706 Transcript_8467/m.10706 type:complete len:234 (-) Transcript_8467:92-793(-)